MALNHSRGPTELQDTLLLPKITFINTLALVFSVMLGVLSIYLVKLSLVYDNQNVAQSFYFVNGLNLLFTTG